ncbi:8-amino-7-oxononanoate synthase [Buttiauxella ferragutiae ATCC 51602]|uniref:8-amino-7-oxononanoate synthase n=1 Tax=Buttiauxella ferragutiae ATCC 51602 TaxID=1354252 RepID=A0ABX2W2F4_9ENTR|nr:8-amino-7-oxononanoate synthase [Buttiauxella ferragutiae]OAT24724.1 8-amino-7-oxononanoate synthase [Buttiauxella ferragutiae ATCC 51602]
MTWQQRIDSALEQRRANDSFRIRQVNQQGSGRYLVQNQTRYLNFSSNDYLGMSHHAQVIQAWQQGAETYGVGSGGSGHVTGYHETHQQFEQQLADWLGFPRALLFISGFAANQALIAALTEKSDRIIADKLSHASLLEAAMNSPAQLRRFTHNDVPSLQALLAHPHEGQQLVVTEGVFSMDGDAAPLAEIAQISRNAGALLMVDDAHGIGVMGEEGRGSCDQQQIKPDLLVVTFGKAFGAGGAAVLCSESLADYLLQFARHLIYSTAMPPAQACALSAALNVIRHDESRRAQLRANIAHFRSGAAQLPLKLMASQTAIQPLIVGENQAAVNLASTMRERGFWMTAIRPPTVPPGTARLRVTLTASHTADDIDKLLEALYDATR